LFPAQPPGPAVVFHQARPIELSWRLTETPDNLRLDPCGTDLTKQAMDGSYTIKSPSSEPPDADGTYKLVATFNGAEETAQLTAAGILAFKGKAAADTDPRAAMFDLEGGEIAEVDGHPGFTPHDNDVCYGQARNAVELSWTVVGASEL